MIGTTLAHYRIGASLGAGGMGEVYRATDTKLGREVALKVLPAAVASDGERLERFRREAKALAALDHPGIVTVYSVEEAGSVHFLTMQLVEGTPLDEVIGEGPLAPERIVAIGSAIAEALAAAHDRGIVHRDLKPANVMIGNDGRVRVLDFGLAKLAESRGETSGSQLATRLETGAGVVMGTLPYMSPEQIEGRALDARTDIFSLGVMLWEMAAGRRPFRGDSAAALTSSILRDDPPSLRALRSGVPTHLASVVEACLRKSPQERPPSMRVVAGRLLAPDTSPGPWRLWRVAALAAGVMAIVIVAWLLLRPVPPSVPPPAEVPRLAVLPFADLSPGADQEWFADGTHEALLSALQQIQGLRVTSRTSSMQYRDTDKLAPQIASELNVRWLVEGSVAHVGERMRISAQLVDAAADQQVWASQYERDVEDLLAVQSEVARAIVQEIDAAVTPAEERRLAAAGRVDPDAYGAYVLGRHHFFRITPSDYRQSVEAFERAITIEPAFAPAHAMLAVTHAFASEYGWIATSVARPLAEEAAAAARRLAPDSADAELALGAVAYYISADLPAAERHLRRSVELRAEAFPIDTLAFLLTQMGRPDEAVATQRRAVELDPRSPLAQNDLGWWLFAARDYEGTVAQAMAAFELDPLFPEAHWLLALAYSHLGRFDEASAAWQRYEELYGDRNFAFGGYLHALAGEREAALAALQALEQRIAAGQSRDIERALIYLGLGDTESVLQVLEAAPEGDISFMPYMWPEYEPLLSDPRLQEIMRRFGIPVRPS